MKNIEEWYKNKKVLVTGGAGFIGSHLAENLVELGAHVTVIDNLSTGSKNNLANILSRISFLEGDITNPLLCDQATHHQNVIFHLAAFVSVPQSFVYPELCYKTNIQATENILRAAAKNNVTAVIFSSSSAVYGEQEKPCKESAQLHPQSPYAFSKIEGENLCKAYSKKYGISTASLRYFNVYGPRQNPDGHYAAVVAKFTQQLIHHKPLTIYGNGLQTRDFIHVQNVVEANLITGALPGMIGEVFNIGTGTSMTLLQLISQLERELGIKPVEVIFNPARNGDIKQSSADCSKYNHIRTKLGLSTYIK